MTTWVQGYFRDSPLQKQREEMNSLLLGYVRTRRCQEQEAALNRMALQLNHVIESDRLDGWPDAERERAEQSF